MPTELREGLARDSLKDEILRGNIVAILSIFFSVAAMFGSVCILHQRHELTAIAMRILNIGYEKCGKLKYGCILNAIINTGAAGYALSVASTLTAVILIIAIRKRSYKLMVPWMIFNGLMIGCSIYFGVYLVCLTVVGPPKIYLPLFGAILLFVVCYTNMLKIICGLFKIMEREEQTEQTVEMELTDFTNTDDDAESNKSNSVLYLPTTTSVDV